MIRSVRLATVALVLTGAALAVAALPAAGDPSPCVSTAASAVAPPSKPAAEAAAPPSKPATEPAAPPSKPASAPASQCAAAGDPASSGGSGAKLAVALVAVLVLAGAAGAFVFYQRRQRLAAAYGPAGYTGVAGPPSREAAGVTPFSAPPRTAPRTRPQGQDETRLAQALRDVAGSGISAALTQQADRLLARLGVTRAELVQAAVRFRDQLLERDPRAAARLLDALHDAGVRETVVEGVRVDGQRHEVVGSVPAPTPTLHDTVAETTQCGYVDGDRVLRLPKVLVYRA
ncbi:nucleotide exchange factor GrpE [Dactylosporangium salmoneum]|uniref:GrpE protein n=1 Tax=Dactylosporangium salmoneum TaxID=53361 RepID=A0ABN3FR60_9ACTN